MDPRTAYAHASYHHVSDVATHYPVKPAEVDAWLVLGNTGKAITKGMFSERDEEVDLGDVDQIKHTPRYRMTTAEVDSIGVKADHTLLINGVRYLIVYARRSSSGNTTFRLQKTKH